MSCAWCGRSVQLSVAAGGVIYHSCWQRRRVPLPEFGLLRPDSIGASDVQTLAPHADPPPLEPQVQRHAAPERRAYLPEASPRARLTVVTSRVCALLFSFG